MNIIKMEFSMIFKFVFYFLYEKAKLFSLKVKKEKLKKAKTNGREQVFAYYNEMLNETRLLSNRCQER